MGVISPPMETQFPVENLSPSETGWRRKLNFDEYFSKSKLPKILTIYKLWSLLFHFSSFLSVKPSFHELSPVYTGHRIKWTSIRLQYAFWIMQLRTEIPLPKIFYVNPPIKSYTHILFINIKQNNPNRRTVCKITWGDCSDTRLNKSPF